MVTKIYDYFQGHKAMLWSAVITLTSFCALSALSLSYQEDIGAFLPLDGEKREAMEVYQDVSGANRLVVIFDNPDDDELTMQAIDRFAEEASILFSQREDVEMTTSINMEEVAATTRFLYENAPYFLTESDWQRIDSIMLQKDVVSARLQQAKEMLMFPSSALTADIVSHDPLGLFSSTVQRLQMYGGTMNFDTSDGYIFTADRSRAIVMLTSPYGNSETAGNAVLIENIEKAIEKAEEACPGVKAHVIGGPKIAVDNANRIKQDSVLAVALSTLLIMALLIYAFRSLRHIVLIAISIAWGWLFALAGMALLHDEVSIIVIGISSIIIGIAVNYPLHLIAHTAHATDMRSALKEIVTPLLIGNITTVGAFMALIPLQSTAMRDLGIFASLLLVGTILFVLFCLPHFVKSHSSMSKSQLQQNSSVCEKWRIPAAISPLVLIIVLLCTCMFGWYSLQTEFDSDITNINYMTEVQKEDMSYFQSYMGEQKEGMETVYIISSDSTYDAALAKCDAQQRTIDSLCSSGDVERQTATGVFLPSMAEQKIRLARWCRFVEEYRSLLTSDVQIQAAALGFRSSAFEPFLSLVENSESMGPQQLDYFSLLTDGVLTGSISQRETKDGVRCSIVEKIAVPADDVQQVEALFPMSFDIRSMNGSLAASLSDNFNYIGWVCSAIVFLFLWFSFGRIELAIISFLPMAVSWVWILGIMAMCGMKFNIVNVILATFIFGQGDDYTIFMTEGCQYEYAYRRPILASYKRSIILSAMIMFIGIGSLIFAKHPAMHSLAEVTIVGMSCVVLMAWKLPPLAFHWLVMKDGRCRRVPLSIASLFGRDVVDNRQLVIERYRYKGMDIERQVRKSLTEDYLTLIPQGLKGEFRMHCDGYGEQAILLALERPDTSVVAEFDDADKMQVAQGSAEGVVNNLIFILKK